MRVLLALACCGLATACNVSQEGAEGRVLFTPDDCGRASGCDFDDSIGAGGVVNLWISGTEGVSTVGLDVVSSDPSVFDVVPIADVGARPTWQITAGAPGVARLEALDGAGARVDFLEVGVQTVAALQLDEFIGESVVDTSGQDFDEVWTVQAGTDVSFFTTPLLSGGAPTMGVFEYDVVVDQALAAGMLAGADIPAGYLYFNVPPGEYTATISNAFGVGLEVLFVAVQ